MYSSASLSVLILAAISLASASSHYSHAPRDGIKHHALEYGRFRARALPRTGPKRLNKRQATLKCTSEKTFSLCDGSTCTDMGSVAAGTICQDGAITWDPVYQAPVSDVGSASASASSSIAEFISSKASSVSSSAAAATTSSIEATQKIAANYAKSLSSAASTTTPAAQTTTYAAPTTTSASTASATSSATNDDDDDWECDSDDNESATSGSAAYSTAASPSSMATTTSAAAQQSSSSSADSGLKLNAGLGFSSSSPAQRTYTTTTQAPTTTTTQAPTTTITTSQAAATTSSSSSSDGSWITGGYATFYYQYGAYGACGKIYPDSSPIVALAIARYGTGSNNAPDCGRQVEIKNDDNGKTVVATVADACPGCANYNSLDLSTGAFDQIADEATGVVPISWKFIS
ncbi:hypothetical protein JCM1841_005326 [Sporobolomyces salmonicolor]